MLEEVVLWIIRTAALGVLIFCAYILSRPNLPKE